MKRFYIFLLLIILGIQGFAQTQQGIVKTRGRMVNGQVVAGQRLTGATITLNIGNPLVSGNNGVFSFNVPSGKNYSLVTAKKQGYTLADPEYTRRSFKYSASNPFYVVLEDEAQRQADINAATRRVRRTLSAQLQAREDEIEALKEQNKLTEEEYQKRLKELYDNQSKSEQLVKEMAERYASTDYDQLDEFNRQVQMYIEEGELQKADSMIRSKGDIAQRVAEYHNAVAANKEKQEKLKREQEELEQSQSGAQKTYEDLSQDLFRRSEIFLQAFQQDSALYCLKMRADLDTTNVSAVWDYALLCSGQNKLVDCETYYLICLRAFIIQNNIHRIASIQNNLGILYKDLHDFANSEKYSKLSLKNYEQLAQEDPDYYRGYLAIVQNTLGVLYNDFHDFNNSEKYYKKSLENYELLFKQNLDFYQTEIARVQNNLGLLYNQIHDYTSSEKYYKLALSNYEQNLLKHPEYGPGGLAMTQTNLGSLYNKLHDFKRSEQYYKLALENYELLFKLNPGAFRQDLAGIQNNLGTLYYAIGDYINGEKYYKLALENKEQLFFWNPDAFKQDLSGTQTNLGILYCVVHDFVNGEKYFKLALENIEQLFHKNPDIYRVDMATIQSNIGEMYLDLHDYANSKMYFGLALENYEQLFLKYPDVYRSSLASTLNYYARLHTDLKEYDEAITSISKAIALVPNHANFYDSKGEILLKQGKNDEALEMWKKVLELNPNFLKENPDGTELSNGLKKLGLIE